MQLVILLVPFVKQATPYGRPRPQSIARPICCKMCPSSGQEPVQSLTPCFVSRLATKVGQTRACGQPRALTEHTMRFVRSGWLCHLRTLPWHGNGDAT